MIHFGITPKTTLSCAHLKSLFFMPGIIGYGVRRMLRTASKLTELIDVHFRARCRAFFLCPTTKNEKHLDP